MSSPIAWADGGTGGSNASSVATNTNGHAFSAPVALGDRILCVCENHNVTGVSQAATLTDTLSTNYGSALVHFLDVGSNYEFTIFEAPVSSAGTPVVTYTNSLSSSISISCIAVRGVDPVTPYNIANWVFAGFSAGASPAANSLSSGNTPALTAPTSLVLGWMFAAADGGPPTAVGSSPLAFTKYGSNMSNTGFLPSSFWEYANVSSSAAVAANATPFASQRNYAFAMVYNDAVNLFVPYNNSALQTIRAS